MDNDRRAQLLALKLRALMGAAGEGAEPGDFGLGAAALVDGVAWVLLEQQPGRGLGPALAWALRRQATRLILLTEQATGSLARRAEWFSFPIEVRLVEGAAHVPALPEPLAPPAPLRPGHADLAAMIVEGGAQPVEEHGVLGGEVRGLEVCRVVDDANTGAVRLDVGIGADDREMFQMLHGDKPTVQALADVVTFVAAQRVPGAPRHPMNLLAQERLLRALLVDEPARLGATSVAIAAPPQPRQNLKDAVPCVAVAQVEGRAVAVVCSSGVDLDLVPFAVDACSALGLDECMVVVPARDALPIQHAIAACARPTIMVVGLDAVA